MSVMREGIKINDDGSINVTFASGSTIDSPTFTGIVRGGLTLLAQSFADVTVPADTTEDTLATITVPANALGANGALLVHVAFSGTNSANTKILRVRYSGAAGTTVAATISTNVNAAMTLMIGNQNAAGSQRWTTVGSISIAPTPISTTSAVDTTGPTTLVLTGQKQLGAETMTLNGYSIWVLR